MLAVSAVIDVPLLYRVQALVNGIADRRADSQLAELAALARDAPDRLAEVVMVLAVAYTSARGQRADVALLIEDINGGPLDLSPVARQGHREYERFRERGEAHYAPPWVMAAERAHSRISAATRRARRAQTQEERAG